MRWSLCVLVLLLGVSLAPRARAAASPAPAAPSRFATLDGMKVHYKVYGPAGRSALVLVHGWTCDGAFWDAQAAALGPLVRTVVLDLPGHGRSDKPEVAYTMDLFARAVDAVLRDAGVERAVLAGHSMGTPVVRQFYRLFPGKTVGLVAVDGALRPYFTDPAKKEAYLSRYAGPDALEVRRKGAESMLSTATPREARERIVATMVGTPAHVALSAQRGMMDDSIWMEDPIGVPLLLVLARSPFWSDDYLAAVRRLAPGMDAVLVDGAGHFVQIDKPDLVNGLLRVFLVRLGLVPA